MSKVGRNDPCPCGSGKKYKKCCEKKANMPFFQKKEIKHIQAKGVSSVFQNAFGSQSQNNQPQKTQATQEGKETNAIEKKSKQESGKEKEAEKDEENGKGYQAFKGSEHQEGQP